MILQFQNIHLRRIYWAITSPSLLIYPFCTNYLKDKRHESAVMQKLLELDHQPEKVNKHFNNLGYMPMGKYFEHLVFYMLKNDNRFELMLVNHQIKEGNRTIGELDLIVRDVQTGKREHWEIALKFYLKSGRSEEQQKMIGPNAVDNLGRKMEKLTNKQMPLSQHSSIKYLVGAEKIQPKLFMKGQFFYYLDQVESIPIDSNPNHEKHWWCYSSEINETIADNLKWCILEKPNWIGRHQTNNSTHLLDSIVLKDKLSEYFDANGKSVLVAGMVTTENGWIEQTRGFVVNSDWPNIKVNN